MFQRVPILFKHILAFKFVGVRRYIVRIRIKLRRVIGQWVTRMLSYYWRVHYLKNCFSKGFVGKILKKIGIAEHFALTTLRRNDTICNIRNNSAYLISKVGTFLDTPACCGISRRNFTFKNTVLFAVKVFQVSDNMDRTFVFRFCLLENVSSYWMLIY